MKTALSRFALLATGFISCLFLMLLSGFEDKPLAEEKSVQNINEHKWFAPALPATIDFAGEAAPLDRWDVKEQLDREILFNYYEPGNILYMQKLASRYFPVIEEILRSHNVPDDLKYVCVAESNLTNAISKAGAVGFWQFMKGTAPGYNIEVSETVDERYNVIKSTHAACTYLRQAYKRFGSWTAAAASYNCGMGRYQQNVTHQQTSNYYDLVLPDETQRYIFRILAFKHLLTGSDSLGFALPQVDRYASIKTRTLTVNSSIPDLASYARKNGSNYKMLKWHNPWLRARSLKAKPGKIYAIILPAD